MKPIATVLAVAGLVAGLAGCADDAGTLGPASTGVATTPRTSTTPATPVPSGPDVLYQVWLVRDGALFQSYRAGRAHVRAVGARALAALVAGPTPAQARIGVSTALSPRDKPVVVDVSDGVATVVAAPAFRGGGRSARRLREAQVVFTLTEYQSIRAVRFASTDGAPTGPVLSRGSLRDVLAPIVVDEPRGGASTHSPLKISGTANVFEATVSIRVLDAAGRTIARTFTTATCGTGCRGDYSALVRYAVDTTQNGTVEVFDVSAKDGSPRDVVAVPVRLSRPVPKPPG